MNHELLTSDDLDVLAHYGRTMASVQEFEFAMMRLARLILPQLSDGVPFEKAWNRVERQFKKADGPLAKPLAEAEHVPREILNEIQLLLRGRKNLAHEFLLSYMLERSIGAVHRAEQISILHETETDFLEWRDFINALYEAVAPERSVTPKDLDFTLGDIRQTFEQQDTRGLLSAYGKAMYAVQLWERSLEGLLVFLDLPGDDEDTTFDEAWESVERTLRTAAGPLRRRLEVRGHGPQALHDELESFRNHRNELAHAFFVDYARTWASEGPRARGTALEFLEAMQILFSEHRAKLDELSDAQAAERGWDLNDLGGLTEEELWRIALRENEAGEE
jgi:hypothetical protein